MKLAGTVILYNPQENVKEYILTYLPYIDKLYVIDNSDTEHSFLLPKNKKIEYICNYKNLGIATALNMGAKKAIKDGYTHLLTMDQDSHFLKNEFSKFYDLVEQYEDESIAIYSPYHNVPTKEEKSHDFLSYPIEVMTSGNILSLNCYKEVGGFKDDFFIDVVDTEMCLHLKTYGKKIVVFNEIELEHQLGNAKIKHFFGKKVICSNHAPIRRYYMMRNTLYVCKMYESQFPTYCKFLKKVQRHYFVNVLLFEKNRFKKAHYMLLGVRDFKKNIMGKCKFA